MVHDKVCKNLQHAPNYLICADHYGCIYENNHLVTLLVDFTHGNIVDANKAACEFYGYTTEVMTSFHISDLTVIDDDTPEGFMQKALPNGRYSGNQVLIERHRLSDGSIIDVEIHTGLINMLGKKCIYSVIHNISERVKTERKIKESEERYKRLVELCPEPILVHSNGTILFVNNQAETLFGLGKEELVGRKVSTFFGDEFMYSDFYKKTISKDYSNQIFRFEQQFIRSDQRMFDLEISGIPIIYMEQKAIQLVIRDITVSKAELARAIRIQEQRHAASFPLESKADLQKLYVPAATLSGDFFIFHKIDEERVIGIIGDVTGKGITAALNISAIRVLFMESLHSTHEPIQILQDLNQKAMLHLEEDYFAVCCFHLDFSEGKLTAAGAGINEFIFIPKDHLGVKQIIKGAPIGMFNDSEFDEVVIPFTSGDRFCFFSDGMEFLINENEENYEFKYLQSMIANTPLQDDCTWLSLNIR